MDELRTPFRWPAYVDITVAGTERRFQRSHSDAGKYVSPGGYWCLEGGSVVGDGYSFASMEIWTPSR